MPDNTLTLTLSADLLERAHAQGFDITPEFLLTMIEAEITRRQSAHKSIQRLGQRRAKDRARNLRGLDDNDATTDTR